MNYEEFFALAKKKKIDNIQITEKTTISSSFELINQELDSYGDSNNINYSIKAEKDGKTVKTQTEYLSEEILDDLIINIENTDSSYEDEYLKEKEQITKEEVPSFDISNELKSLKECAKLRKKYSDIDKLTISFSEDYINTRIINANSVDISTASHQCKLYVEAIARKDDQYASFSNQLLETDKNKFNFSQFIEDALTKATILMNKEKLETKKYNLVLDSAIASCIISNLATMVSAANIREKTSCLEKKINTKVFSEKLTIIEDPRDKKYPGYRLFDDEGTETYKKNIVKNGIIETSISNIKEAKINKSISTGNAYSGIGTRNMYIVPGEKTLEELLQELDNGIYITDYMGASGTSISTVTGNISLQIFGFKIEDGKIVSGIEPCIMTTTIFELLSNIREVGSDLQFIMTSSASPSLLIDSISIARWQVK